LTVFAQQSTRTNGSPCFYNPNKNEAVIVTSNGNTFPEAIEGIHISVLNTGTFTEKMEQKDIELIACLQESVDLLGNREDFLWRIVENTKLNIPKGEMFYERYAQSYILENSRILVEMGSGDTRS
jgi:hypothetical protein